MGFCPHLGGQSQKDCHNIISMTLFFSFFSLMSPQDTGATVGSSRVSVKTWDNIAFIKQLLQMSLTQRIYLGPELILLLLPQESLPESRHLLWRGD